MSISESVSAKISCGLCKGIMSIAFGPGPSANMCVFTYLPADKCSQEEKCTDYIEKTLMELPELTKVISIGKSDGY